MADLHLFEEFHPWLSSPELLCEPEDLYAIRQIPRSVTDVGMCLKLDQRDIYQIDHNYRDIYEKIYYLLLCWRTKNGPNATWWNLILCLRCLDDAQLLEDVKMQIQKKYAKDSCKGYEYYMDQDHMAKMYEEESRKSDSGIIVDLSHVVPSSSMRGSCDLSPDHVPSMYDDDYSDICSSGDGEFSNGGLTSLHAASFQSCQPSSSNPKSFVSCDSLYSDGVKFYTPNSTMDDCDAQESNGNGHQSESTEDCTPMNDQDHMASICEQPSQPPMAGGVAVSLVWEAELPEEDHDRRHLRAHRVPCEHERLRRDLEERNRELQQMKELYREESKRVNALKKMLVHAHSKVFEETQEKKNLQSKVEECQQLLSCLLDHLKACDERYADMYRKSQQDTSPSVRAELAVLEQEKAALTEELRNLETKYKQAVSDIQFLQRACTFAMEDQQLEEMKRYRCKQDRVRLECRLAELSAINGELHAQNMRLVEQLTSPTSCVRLALRREEHQEVVLRGKKCRDSTTAQRRCLSDGCEAVLPEDCLNFTQGLQTNQEASRRRMTEVHRRHTDSTDQFSGLDSSPR